MIHGGGITALTCIQNEIMNEIVDKSMWVCQLLLTLIVVPKQKESIIIIKVKSRCLKWFEPQYWCPMLVHHYRLWLLHTKLYEIALNFSENNYKMVRRADLRLRYVVYLWGFCNFSISWLFCLMVSNLFFHCVTVKINALWFNNKIMWRKGCS